MYAELAYIAFGTAKIGNLERLKNQDKALWRDPADDVLSSSVPERTRLEMVC
jgi:hypothetical protein